MAEQTVKAMYEKDTKNSVRYLAAGFGVLYVPKAWFGGKEAPKEIEATFKW
jgi:hypothetical protein